MTRLLGRHVAALVASVAALAACPYLAEAVQSALQPILQPSGFMHFYAMELSWGDGSSDGGAAGLFILVALVAIVCAIGDRLCKRWRFLSWLLPPLVAVPLGMWAAFISREDVPLTGLITIGVTVASLALTLVGAYWWTLQLASRLNRSEAQ